MKKFLVLAISVVCLASGCTKKYDSVEEFEKDMIQVQNKNLQQGYYFFVENHIPTGKTFPSFTYIKNNKWKDVLGKHNIVVSNGQETYHITPNIREKVNIAKSLNYGLFEFHKTGNLEKHFINQNENINGMKCRMIGYGKNNDVEECVSDKYGIAIYYKINNSFNAELNGQIAEVKNIEIKNLSDSEFQFVER